MNGGHIKSILRSKSSNSNVIKLKSTTNSSNKSPKPKFLVTTHYIGNLENKFGMFTREQIPQFNLTSRDKIILKFTNPKLNSLVHSPKINIKYQKIPIQDATYTGIDRFLQSINFSFQTNLNLFHSSSSRNINEGNQLQPIKEKNNNNNNNVINNNQHNMLLDNQSKQMHPINYNAKRNIGNKSNNSKDNQENYYKLKPANISLTHNDKDNKMRQTHQFLPTIKKKMMFRKRNYTQSDLCSLYSLFYLNSPNQKRIIDNDESKL